MLDNYQLNQGHIFLPPEVFPIFGAKGGDEIITVHNNMYYSIEETYYETLFTS